MRNMKNRFLDYMCLLFKAFVVRPAIAFLVVMLVVTLFPLIVCNIVIISMVCAIFNFDFIKFMGNTLDDLYHKNDKDTNILFG